jgi:hypothetical protein
MIESAPHEDAPEAPREVAELGSTEPELTGVPAVDDALARLTALDALPVDEHPALFESVHGSLRGVLASDNA